MFYEIITTASKLTCCNFDIFVIIFNYRLQAPAIIVLRLRLQFKILGPQWLYLSNPLLDLLPAPTMLRKTISLSLIFNATEKNAQYL